MVKKPAHSLSLDLHPPPPLHSEELGDRPGAKQAVLHSNMAAATSVVVLDRGNNTTCTINLHGKWYDLLFNNEHLIKITIWVCEKSYERTLALAML